MTDRGCCSPVRERIDDGGVEPRWRRPTGKAKWVSAAAVTQYLRKKWVWDGGCRPQEQDEAPRGSAATRRRVVSGIQGTWSCDTMLQMRKGEMDQLY